MLAHLIVVEFHVLIAESDADIETTELAPEFHKCGDVTFINPIVGIRHFRNVCGK